MSRQPYTYFPASVQAHLTHILTSGWLDRPHSDGSNFIGSRVQMSSAAGVQLLIHIHLMSGISFTPMQVQQWFDRTRRKLKEQAKAPAAAAGPAAAAAAAPAPAHVDAYDHEHEDEESGTIDGNDEGEELEEEQENGPNEDGDIDIGDNEGVVEVEGDREEM